MRLYLSSYRLGCGPDELLALMRGGRRAAIISNALDHISADARALYRTTVYDPFVDFLRLGITAENLDLRDYFGEPGILRERLARVDLVWLMGGNSFILRRAMRQSGFDRVIATLLDRDEVVYGGFSAGAVVAAPSLAGIELMDDPLEVPAGYETDIVWDGLGLVEHAIVPHFRSEHPEAALAERAATYLTARGLPFRTLHDGEVFIRDGVEVVLKGHAYDAA
ncbi:MAG TPA: Type 1 glutamine amidotransferase-like domain-containing protein [Devosiaceae bacterium]